MRARSQKILKKIKKIIAKKGYPDIKISIKDQIVCLKGKVNSWEEVVELGHQAGKLKEVNEVVNEVVAKEVVEKKERRKEKKLATKIYTPKLPRRADLVVVGGGVVGCFIARELSRYKLDIVLVEKEWDVAGGASKANSAQVHTGIGEDSGTLKKELCAKSYPLFDKLAKELDIPYKKNGLLIVLTKDTFPKKIPSFIANFISKCLLPFFIVRKGKKVGDKPRVILKKELLKMEPNLTDRALKGVLMPAYGIICPYKFTIALAENAIRNGVKILFNTEVKDIEVENKEVKRVITNRGAIETKFIINAAGVFGDKISEMAGIKEFTIHPRKGSILLFDKEMEGYINHQISELKFPRAPYTKGGAVLMTVDGNPNWGPTANEVPDKEDKSVSKEEIGWIYKKFGTALPNFPKKSVITYFAGLRAPTYKEDFYIKASERIKGFVNVSGIQSPGLTAAPAIAEMVLKILKGLGLKMEKKEDFNPIRKAPPIFDKLCIEEKKKLINQNPLYGKIVCRCEHITEGEILDAIHSSLPALTLDAIKRRTRAGMGRCQGGFCGPRVAKILARELGIPLEEVTKEGGNSNLFIKKSGG